MSEETASGPIPTALELGRSIAFCRREIWIAAGAALDQHDVRMIDWQILAILDASGALTQRELAHLCVQHEAGISRQLSDLEKRKLVQRRRDPADRRRMMVHATAAGQALMEKHRADLEQACDQVLIDLDPAQRRQLAHLLAAVVERESIVAHGCTNSEKNSEESGNKHE